MEELVYWTPFWSFTSISSTSLFAALHSFSGATDESLCSGATWIFILFCGARDRGGRAHGPLRVLAALLGRVEEGDGSGKRAAFSAQTAAAASARMELEREGRGVLERLRVRKVSAQREQHRVV